MSKNQSSKAAKTAGRELGDADQHNIKYLEVRAPIKTDSSGNAQLQDVQIKEFDISN
jgi:hypothetical protein